MVSEKGRRRQTGRYYMTRIRNEPKHNVVLRRFIKITSY